MDASPPPRPARSPWSWIGRSLAVLLIAFAAWWLVLLVGRSETLAMAWMALFAGLCLTALVLGIVGTWAGFGSARRRHVGPGLLAALSGLLASTAAVAMGGYGLLLGAFAAGGGWGRPLRIRGRQRHPELRLGTDWAWGPRPDPAGLDAATAAALEALWLHDAQKEHASVPAFARISWLLAAVGAPAELLAWSQRAALEEIEHARLCFALAAGYGGRAHTVEPMPELLVGGLQVRGNALAVLATESLGDGCLLEDFNADIAAECAAACDEPATRAVLAQIAREERSHAEFSWAVVTWTLAHLPQDVAAALERAIDGLPRYRRPTAVSWRRQALVARADAALLRRHGRLPDERWAEVWQARLQATVVRARGVLAAATGSGAGVPASAGNAGRPGPHKRQVTAAR